MIPARVVIASRAKRFAGFLGDLVVLTGIAVLLVPVTGAPFDDTAGADGTVSAFSIANLVVLAAYQVGFVAVRGQTPGKMMIGTRVVDEATGEIPDFTSSVARFVVPAAAGFIPGVGTAAVIVVYAWILWDPRRQGLHDKLARTIVIDVTEPAEVER